MRERHDAPQSPGSPHSPFERSYRHCVRTHLNMTRVVVQQTDLSIYSNGGLDVAAAKNAVMEQRGYLEAYIHRHPPFLHTLTPMPEDPMAPAIVRKMFKAAQAARVGPMAAVAGAVAEQVGETLLTQNGEIIVENGGDIFFGIRRTITVGIYAGASPLSMKIGLRIEPSATRAICTSSGTVGHSLSFGKADAVCVLSHSCALADAAATAIANRVGSSHDLRSAMAWGEQIQGIKGILIIRADRMAAWGDIEIVPL